MRLIPVDHNPFEETPDTGKKVKLVPVEGNPFEAPAEATQEKAPLWAQRAPYVAAGGMVGSAAGMAFGPAGVIAGGGLGAATGSLLYDVGKGITGIATDQPEMIQDPNVAARTAIREGMIDASFGMGASVLRPILWTRQALGWASGVTTQEARALTQNAEKMGIALGAVDVGGVLPKGYSKAVGVFPWSGTPLRRAELAKQTQATASVFDVLNTYAPNATMADLGVDMVAAARRTYGEFRAVSGALYGNVDELIKNAARQDIIPTESVRTLAGEMAESARAGAIVLQDGSTMPRAAAGGVLDYINKLQNLPDLLTPAQYRQLTGDLSDLIGKNLKDGWDVRQLTQIKKALEGDFANLRVDMLPGGQGAAIKEALDTANTFFSKGIVDFQTPTAGKFKRVDKNIFKAGAATPGTINADELYRAAVDLKSPQDIRDLEKLVGRQNIRGVAQHHVSMAREAALVEVEMLGKKHTLVDPYALEEALGMTAKNAGIEELLRRGGINADDVKSLLSAMKNIQDIANPAEFVRRRTVLGGARGAMAAAGGFGGSVAGQKKGLPGAMITLTFLSRHMSKIFADPKKLKLLTTAMDEARHTVPRQAAWGRLVRMVTADEQTADAKRVLWHE